MRKTMTAALLLLPLAAHADRPPVAQPISWWKAHPHELAETLAVCRDNFQFARTPTCSNAEAASIALHDRAYPNLNAMLNDERYWSANPIARESFLVQCQLGTAMTPQFCKAAARSALSAMDR